MASDLRARLASIEARVAAACERAGRSRNEVALIAVTKTFGPETVEAAIAAGLVEIGENRVQEARDKIASVRGVARWHLIGHLQSNKVRDAASLFDVVHTIDSTALAQKLGRAARERGKVLDVLIQVNVAGEEQKSGVEPENLDEIGRAVSDQESLRLRGLMTIPPFVPAEQARRWFRMLREARDAARVKWENCTELSMGMSDDFEVAIEEGATMVRLGRALFGERG